MSRKKVDIVLEDITIEAVAAEGKAIAHSPDGQVVFVPFAVPGDVVDIRIFKKKKGCSPSAFRENYHKSKIII